uniref:Uncharacterized protein n=1 Tax=Arundo donax TaxID=35708 RepID=A0A0A8ZQ60_ARUDO
MLSYLCVFHHPLNLQVDLERIGCGKHVGQCCFYHSHPHV